MVCSSLNIVRGADLRLPRVHAALAAVAAFVALAAPAPGRAAPPSPIVEEHLVAQAGFSVGFGLNQLTQLLVLLGGIGASSCSPVLGLSELGAENSSGAEAAMFTVYYDTACQKPYEVDSLEISSSGGLDILAHTIHLNAPNGAMLGDLAMAQQLTLSNPIILNDKGTYKAVAGVGQPPVRVGLACQGVSSGNVITFTCQEGMAQDFPALKMSLGTIANMNVTLTEVAPNVFTMSATGSNAKLATGKLGGLSITVTSPTTLGFQGQATTVGTGSLTGSSPSFSPINPAGTLWSFNDSQHATKFSVATPVSLNSSGKVKNSSTNATASFTVDKSGTGTITYSDSSKAKITNWTLSD